MGHYKTLNIMLPLSACLMQCMTANCLCGNWAYKLGKWTGETAQEKTLNTFNVIYDFCGFISDI